MDAEFLAILSAASEEAEGHQGETFTGPDGQPYVGVFAAPDAFQIAAEGLTMQANGFSDRTTISLICTVGQFTQPPLSWRRKFIVRTAINPPQRLHIQHVTADDPLHYGFVLLNHQPAAQPV